MLLIRPATVDDTALVSSNVQEVVPAAYNSGTTYGAGAIVGTTSGTTVTVYESLQAGNLNKTPASEPTWWRAVSTTQTVYNSGTSYSQGQQVRGNATENEHRIFESKVNSNSGNALTDDSKWLEVGPTNRWAMFDTIVGTQTERAEEIVVEVTSPGRVDSVAALNVDAVSITVTMTDTIDGLVYNETISLVSPSGIADWYDYFFEPIERLSDVVIMGLPPYSGATVEVTLSDQGGTAKCGALVIGQSKDIGNAQYGGTVGIRDYSRKEANDFGDFVVVERTFSKRASFTIWMASGQTDQVLRLLTEYRATPIVYVGSEDYGSTIVFGFYRDFNIELAGPNHSLCSLEIEGLP